MGSNDNKIKEMEEIKKRLTVKRIKGKEYYYTKASFLHSLDGKKDKISKEFYICPVNIPSEEFMDKVTLAQLKIFTSILCHRYYFVKKYHKKSYLSDKQLKHLEFLRFSYVVSLISYKESDLQKYKDVCFTKYVHGTTSVEGNTYTLRETDLTLNEGLTIGGKEIREFYEIENYAKLRDFIDKSSNIKIDKKFVLKLHSIIMKNIDDQYAGVFRKIDVGIRGTEFTPTPGVLVEDEIDKLFKWLENNGSKLYPIELIAMFHQRFEEIHPFIDGNGRVGRELMRVMLDIFGFPTIFVNMNNREEYLKSLDKGNDKEHKALCNFIVNNLLEVHKSLYERAKEKISKEVEYIEQSKFGKKYTKEIRKIVAKFWELDTKDHSQNHTLTYSL